MGKRRGYQSMTDFIEKLSTLVEGLPSNLDKESMRRSTDVLIDFFGQLRNAFARVPSKEDAVSIKESLEKLSDLIAQAQNDPLLSNMLGLRRKPVRRYGGTAPAVEADRLDFVLRSLESLPVDQIRETLQTDQYTLDEVRGVATKVGIRSTARLSRESLAHQIATKIANFRGYRQLGGDRT